MDQIEKRPFGLNGPAVSVLGLGTVKFGRNTAVKYPHGFTLPDDRIINSLLDLCIENGINLLDTAPAYGTSEERLGKLLGTRRGQFFLVTKTGEEFDGINSEYSFTREHTEMSVSRSLHRLNTTHLDCVLVHSSRDDLNVIQNTPVLETLQRLKDKGDIGAFGVSTYTVEGGKKAVDLCDCVMVSYNQDYRDEESVLNYAQSKNKAVLIKKAMSSGHAANPAENLKFVANTPGVTSIVFGSLNPDNIRNNIAALK